MSEAKYHQIRALIKSAGSRFLTVEFFKVDGSFRKMQVQPMALKNRVKGAAASEQAQRAAATRSANNPNLLNVWDVQKRAPRSINMDTLVAITLDGVRYDLSERA